MRARGKMRGDATSSDFAVPLISLAPLAIFFLSRAERLIKPLRTIGRARFQLAEVLISSGTDVRFRAIVELCGWTCCRVTGRRDELRAEPLVRMTVKVVKARGVGCNDGGFP